MSSFLDMLGDDPETGEQPVRSLHLYDSREDHDVKVSPDEIYENRTSRKLAWQKGYEPVIISKTDPLSDFAEIEPEKHGEGENGPYTKPEQYRLAFKVKFEDPASGNAGREWYYWPKGWRTVLDEDAKYYKSDKKNRKAFCFLLASFLDLAEYDMSGFTGDHEDDAETRKLWDAFLSVIDSFDGQQVWLNYQVGWYMSSKTGQYELSEKVIRVGAE